MKLQSSMQDLVSDWNTQTHSIEIEESWKMKLIAQENQLKHKPEFWVVLICYK